jgi:hypothetical protein
MTWEALYFEKEDKASAAPCAALLPYPGRKTDLQGKTELAERLLRKPMGN